jgi:hypothetical protein
MSKNTTNTTNNNINNDSNVLKSSRVRNFLNASKNFLVEDTNIHNVSDLVNSYRITMTAQNSLQDTPENIDTTDALSDPYAFHKIFSVFKAKKDSQKVDLQVEMTEFYESEFKKLWNSLVNSSRSFNINARDIRGKTLLHYAIYNSCWKIVETLLSKENHNFLVNLNIQDNFGRTPLNTCPKIFFSKPDNRDYIENYLKIFRLMVYSGSNLYIPDLSDQVPWRILQNHLFDETDFLAKCCEEDFTWFQFFYLLKDPLRGLHQFLQGKFVVSRKVNSVSSSIVGDDRSEVVKESMDTFHQESHFSLIHILEEVLIGGKAANEKNPYVFKDCCQRDILKYLLFIYHNIQKAANCHSQQSRKLKKFNHKVIIPMIENVFLSEGMEDPLNVQLLLHRYMFTFEKEDHFTCARNLYEYFPITEEPFKRHRKVVHEKINEDVYKYEPLLLIQYRAFSPNFLLKFALTHEIKFIFNIIQLANIIDEIFFKSLRYECRKQKEFYDLIFKSKHESIIQLIKSKNMNDQNELLEYSGKLKQARYQIRPDNTSYYEIYNFFSNLQDNYQGNTTDDQNNDLKQQHDDDEEQRDNILLDYHLFSFNLRFAPCMHFTIQCFTRIALVVLIVEISVHNYSENYGTYYTKVHDTTSVTIAECWLFYLVCGEFLYEVGCVLELLKPKSIIDLASFFYYCGKHYKSRLGITLDWISILLLMMWGFFRFTAIDVVGDLDVSRVILAVDAIPLTLSLFRFTSFYKPLGELLFTFQKITNDIIVFGIFYFLIIVGFGTAIFCLFHNNAEFPSVGLMFLTLFENSLGSFDFEIFNTNSVAVNTIGVLILVTFLVVIPLITINLFIARLSYIYEKIHLKAEEERAFVKSHFIARYLHLNEVHPLCMLPAPFNLLTGLAALVHWCYSFCKQFFLHATDTVITDTGNNNKPVDERLRPDDKNKILRYPESFS